MDLTIALHTAFVLTAGFSDNVGPALQIGASARHDWDNWGLSLGLEMRGIFPAGVVAREVRNTKPGETPLPPAPFDVSQLAAQLVPCAHFAKYLAGCAVVQGFVLLTQAGHLETAPGWGLGPRLTLEIPFADRFAVFGFGEALIPVLGLEQPFGYTNGLDLRQRVWSQSIVSGFFGVGVSVNFK
jgi:hypothetical protein